MLFHSYHDYSNIRVLCVTVAIKLFFFTGNFLKFKLEFLIEMKALTISLRYPRSVLVRISFKSKIPFHNIARYFFLWKWLRKQLCEKETSKMIKIYPMIKRWKKNCIPRLTLFLLISFFFNSPKSYLPMKFKRAVKGSFFFRNS